MKKNHKIIISILLVIALCCTLVACGQSKKPKHGEEEVVTVTEAVTDEAGEVVTAADGEVVTEVVEAEVKTEKGGEVVTEIVTQKSGEPLTQKNGSKVTRAVVIKTSKHVKTTKVEKITQKGDKTTAKGDDKATTKKGDKSTTKKGDKPTKAPEKQPEAPEAVTGLKATAATSNSISLSWNKIDCDGYEVNYSTDGKSWEQALVKANAVTIRGLTSYTKYYFRVRGYVTYGNGTMYASNKWAEATKSTEPNRDNKRQIKLVCTLPVTGKADKLTIWVKTENGDWEEDSTQDIASCDGLEHTFKTQKEYKGLVKVKVKLRNAKATAESEFTDKNSVSLELTTTKIDVAMGEDD